MIAPWLGPALLLTGVGSAMLFMLVGFSVVARTAIHFGDRLAAYADSPLLEQADEVQRKLARVEWRVSEISNEIERAGRALVALRDSRLQVRAIGESLSFAAQLARAMFLGRKERNES